MVFYDEPLENVTPHVFCMSFMMGSMEATLRDELSQLHFEGAVRSPLTLPKMRLGSPLGLPRTQSVIAEVKTPRIRAFFILLERS
jgi:hypothetical protein